jgi:S-DNA-T family DNA segregation ATPase FtsK/SpoIIIE
MSKKKKNKKERQNGEGGKREFFRFDLAEQTKRKIYGVIMFLIAIIISFSFFDKAGIGGDALMKFFSYLIGRAVFILPLLFVLGGLVFFNIKQESGPKKEQKLIIGGIFLCLLGITGMMGIYSAVRAVSENYGGILGYFLSSPIIKFLGIWGGAVVFIAVVVIGAIILCQSLPFSIFDIIKKRKGTEEQEDEEELEVEVNPQIFQKTGDAEFKVKQIAQEKTQLAKPVLQEARGLFSRKIKPDAVKQDREEDKKEIAPESAYCLPSLDLLERDSGVPFSGDVRANSAIIKKTLQNFDISVEMAEVNIGPTVAQYTLKPAEGVKLSRITALSNDLSMALATPSIRIEAPIPGRPLVGIEIPNKKRAKVGLKSLLEYPEFQNSSAHLVFALGRDAAGNPVFDDIAKMPHMIVAGSTGSGKTICLNGIILSLIYKNSPTFLRFIMIDPKRVEFPVYNDLPHLLSPVIYSAQKTIDVLKWLIGEMERRFDVLSENKVRNIIGYNEIAAKQAARQSAVDETLEPMPYIVLIIDELADVMASRGRDVEAGIVRLAQMSRAVGIHLVLATQRPSVEVITGLIKANITSRIAFQVASQIDSRTILDVGGAEKLLGSGDMLYVSSNTARPKRVQGAYISEKEVKKAVDFIKSQITDKPLSDISDAIEPGERKEAVPTGLETALAEQPAQDFSESEDDDPLYEEAKRVVIESKRASSSLLQRRLRIGYARAARLIDVLEEKGVVGPGEGAKPREVFVKLEGEQEVDEEGYMKV